MCVRSYIILIISNYMTLIRRRGGLAGLLVWCYCYEDKYSQYLHQKIMAGAVFIYLYTTNKCTTVPHFIFQNRL